ncbi:MAG: lipopolysaccharide biosynthesis protein RfbH [Pseudomonadota bacterium]
MSDIGSLALVKYEYTDKSGWKVRPGLITGEYLNDYQVTFITKEVDKYSHEDTSIIIDNEDLASGALKRKSIVRTHKIFWVEKDQCKKVGTLRNEVTDKILRLSQKYFVRNYYDFAHQQKTFLLGISLVPVSGRVYGPEEMQNLVDSALDFWLTTGRFNDAFEKRFAEYLGVKHVLTTNSGSSANLLAVSALTSPKLEDRRLKPGDEIITVAAAFPTTVNPIIQNGLVPVFVDVDIPTYNIKPELIEKAVSEKTRAIILAHTLGNPFDVNEVLRVAAKYNLWVIEDCSDALGSTYTLTASNLKPQTSGRCGSLGHISTFSFYPAHHITMGEGGAVATNDPTLKKVIESFRDWGRDCWCPPGQDNTCKKRFNWKLGDLPEGYDHKYIYSHAGYNLKITDTQASVALAQMDKLDEFINIRQRNFDILNEGLKDLEEIFILPQPTPDSAPSWFGFPITVKEEANINREGLLQYLNEKKIGTRLLFGGNLTKQPYFHDVSYRIHSDILGEKGQPILPNTDMIRNNTFWLGVYPALTPDHLNYVIESISQYVRKK